MMNRQPISTGKLCCWLCFLVSLITLSWLCSARSALGQTSFAKTAAEVEPKVVKIFGAGGLKGLES